MAVAAVGRHRRTALKHGGCTFSPSDSRRLGSFSSSARPSDLHAAGVQQQRRSRVAAELLVDVERAQGPAPEELRYSLVPQHDSEEETSTLGHNSSECRWRCVQEHGLAILDHSATQCCSALVIIANALVIGFETDYKNFCCWDTIENVFLVFFAVELVARIVIITPQEYIRWSNPDFWWNLFDFGIVTMGFFDLIATAAEGAETEENRGSMKFATLFRIIRLLRILRIFKIIRFLKQLYLLAYGFVEAATAVFWVTVLMAFALYVCAIILSRIYGSVSADDPVHDILVARFGTVFGSMLTLFELMSSPDLSLYQSVIDHHPSILPFLISFIIFGSFGMVALLTGVISESMFEKNQARVEEERVDRERKRAFFQERCQDVFETMDKGNSGTVSTADLHRCKEEIAELLGNAGVSFSPMELPSIIDALDINAAGVLGRLDFESGILQLCEDIRPMSIMELHHQIRKCQGKIEDANQQLGRKLDRVDVRMESLTQAMELFTGKSVPRNGGETSSEAEAGSPPSSPSGPSGPQSRRSASGPALDQGAASPGDELASTAGTHRRTEVPALPGTLLAPDTSGTGDRLSPCCGARILAFTLREADGSPGRAVARADVWAGELTGLLRAEALRQPGPRAAPPEATADVAGLVPEPPRAEDLAQAYAPSGADQGHAEPVAPLHPPTVSTSREADWAGFAELASELAALTTKFRTEVLLARSTGTTAEEIVANHKEHVARLDGYTAALAGLLAPRTESPPAAASALT